MPRAYSSGGRVARGSPARMPGGLPLPNTRSFKERVGALKNLWPFLTMVWRTSRSLTAASLLLRLARALLPVITLYVGKLIIDDVVRDMKPVGRQRRRCNHDEATQSQSSGAAITSSDVMRPLTTIVIAKFLKN